MKVIHLCFNVLGRFFISLVFLAGAVNKILHWHENEKSLLNTLCEWQANVGFSDGLSGSVSSIIPFTPLLLLAATLFEFLGGLSVLLGYKEKWGALLLIFFLIPATMVMHPFWFVEGVPREVQLGHFLKNLAIIGGLILFTLRNEESPKPPFSRSNHAHFT
ncbi:MAG: DoxX family protein [Chlamydiales bacterium]